MAKKKQKETKITIEQLAKMTAKGFLGADKKFEAMDKKFEAMDKKFEAMDKKIDAIDIKFESKLEKMDKKIDKMLNVADHICGEITDWREENAIGAAKDYELQKQADNHERRIINLEQKIQV